MIPFNKPFISGNELSFIQDAVMSGKISGNGKYTKLCQDFFEKRYGFKRCLLTSSCTDALEMTAILIDIQPGDEVIIPSYTFVSTANAFILRGAKIIFADSNAHEPNLDVNQVEQLITTKTKAIVAVHYAGVSVDMDPLMKLATKYNIYVIEDAAQAVDSFYKNRPLGGIGHFAAFSFHETKNLISGEGGMLVVNDARFLQRAEIIWEKGTNRSAFWRGEVDKYGWVDIGSSFLPSEIVAAFLYGQIENLDRIQIRRKEIWDQYFNLLSPLAKAGKLNLPNVPHYATNNAHMFYVICSNEDERKSLIDSLKKKHIYPVFHYISLHASPYFQAQHDGRVLFQSDRFTNQLLRLPMYFEILESDIVEVCNAIKNHYEF